MARLLATVGAVVALGGCGRDSPSVLDPQSAASRRVEDLWWMTFAVATAVVILVIAFILVAVRRRQQPAVEGIDMRPVTWGDRFIVIAGLVVSGAILAGAFAVSLNALDALARPPGGVDMTIDVVGRNWWWEARYPNGAVTANEIHVPVGRTVEVRLVSADVIHSFWVPQLNVKKDNIPGMTNHLWLRADAAGRYRGQCAEYCGLQHAHMAFYVDADPPETFDRWLTAQAAPATAAAGGEAARGRDIFLRSSCAGCHTVRGTPARGGLGPDLTHMASRQTIGAGVAPLDAGNLSAFVLNPQRMKPGVTMPPTEVSPEELNALVAYLLELK